MVDYPDFVQIVLNDGTASLMSGIIPVFSTKLYQGKPHPNFS